jgi:hypothetical protein
MAMLNKPKKLSLKTHSITKENPNPLNKSYCHLSP